MLIDFLNALLPHSNRIIDLSFKNTEQLGQTDADRRAIYDVYCENERGEKFIVELQKAKQNYFKERTIYYSTFPIREQAEKGTWDYQLQAIYCIGILDFTFDDYESEQEKSEVVHTIKLKDQHGKIFYNKLTYIYLEMPNFRKGAGELKTRLDQWLYFIKHLEDFDVIPTIFDDEVFARALKQAELAKYGQAELDSYERSLKTYRDLKGVIDTAFDEGRQEGRIEGKMQEKMEVGKAAKLMGLSIADIIKLTGLTERDIENL